MKIVHFADLHILESRLEGAYGQATILGRAVQMAAEREPALFLVCGDLAGTEVPHRATPAERNYLVEILRQMAETAPVVVVRGNHDSPHDWDFLNFLHADHVIFYVEEPELVQPVPDYAVLVLPWLDRAQYPAEASYPEAVRVDYLDAIEQVRPDIKALERERTPVFVATHAAFQGAMLRDGQPTVPTHDPILDVKEILAAVPFEALFAGHYHFGQQIGVERAWYAGSAFVSQYGEDCPKRFLIYDTQTRTVEWVAIEQPVRLRVELDVERQRVGPTTPDSKLIRPGTPLSRIVDGFQGQFSPMRIKLAARYPEAKREEADLLVRQARDDLRRLVSQVVLDVQIERTLDVREAAQQVARATTMLDKVVAFVRTRYPETSEVALARIKSQFHAVAEDM